MMRRVLRHEWTDDDMYVMLMTAITGLEIGRYPSSKFHYFLPLPDLSIRLRSMSGTRFPFCFWILAKTHAHHTMNTRIVRGIAAAKRTHHLSDTASPCSPKSKKFVLTIVQMNVPGRKTIVTAASVIMEAESRCVCSAIFAVSSAVR